MPTTDHYPVDSAAGNRLLGPTDLVLLMGRPGAGKGTHAARLAAEFGLVAVSTGDIFRRQYDADVSARIAEGHLASESDLKRILLAALRDLKGQPIVLDGATKKPDEARWLLDEALPALGRRLVVVVYLTLDEAVARERITTGNRGRDDDAHHLQDRRSQEFRDHTTRSIELYRQAGLVAEVPSDRPHDAVYADVVAAIRARL